MERRVILIPKDDLVYYPPTISLINVLLKIGVEVVCVGNYSDQERKAAFERAGVTFVPIYFEVKDVSKFRIINWIAIILRGKRYSYRIKKFLASRENDIGNELIWFIYSSTITGLQKYIEKYPYVVQFYEFENYANDGKLRILHPFYDVCRFLNKAKALVHCEYNRAVITNGLYGIDKKFYILPNKPYELKRDGGPQLPDDISKVITDVKKRTEGKKVILYQGIFDSAERRLEEFCEAVNLLSDEYVFVAMGGRGGYFEDIKKKYESDRVIFIPFIRPPHHLHITKMANIGVLTYHPAAKNYVDVLNPLYCAPNKIFEFGKYGIPMIANDVPGLKLIFSEYKCGVAVETPVSPENIVVAITNIERNHNEMSHGAKAYYDSVNIEKIVKEILYQE